MIKLYICICFFIDFTGGPHFERSRDVYATFASCDEFARGYATEKYELKEAGAIIDAWIQCLPVPGFAI